MKVIRQILSKLRFLYLASSVVFLLGFLFLINAIHRIQVAFPRSIHLSRSYTSNEVLTIIQSGFLLIGACLIMTIVLMVLMRKKKALWNKLFMIYFIVQSILLPPFAYVLLKLQMEEVDIILYPIIIIGVLSVFVILEMVVSSKRFSKLMGEKNEVNQ